MLGWPLMDPAASLLVSFLIVKEGTALSTARTHALRHSRVGRAALRRASVAHAATRKGAPGLAGLVLGLASVRELSDEGLTRAELADVNQTALEVCGVTHARQGGLRHYSR